MNRQKWLKLLMLKLTSSSKSEVRNELHHLSSSFETRCSHLLETTDNEEIPEVTTRMLENIVFLVQKIYMECSTIILCLIFCMPPLSIFNPISNEKSCVSIMTKTLSAQIKLKRFGKLSRK
jgi:hypothetical protein